MDGHDGNVDVVEEVVEVFDGESCTHEHHDFLVLVLLQEREQHQEPFLRRAQKETLKVRI